MICWYGTIAVGGVKWYCRCNKPVDRQVIPVVLLQLCVLLWPLFSAEAKQINKIIVEETDQICQLGNLRWLLARVRVNVAELKGG